MISFRFGLLTISVSDSSFSLSLKIYRRCVSLIPKVERYLNYKFQIFIMIDCKTVRDAKQKDV